MARKKNNAKSKDPATLVPDWAVPGLVLLNKKRTPIGDEKGYTHRTAQGYLDPGFGRERRRDAARVHLAGGGSLGLCPPQDVMVIDCDSREAVELIKPMMPRGTPCQFRKEDKQHFYIRVDPALDSFYTNSNIRFERVVIDLRTWGNVDPEMAGGGYAVIPPSISEKDGVAYTWETPLPSTIEEIPILPREVAEILQPFCMRTKSKKTNAGAEVSRHKMLLDYVNRSVRYESRTDPEASIARIITRASAYAGELYAGDDRRLQEEIESLDRYARTAWDQWGGAGALDENTQDHWFGMMIAESEGEPWLFPREQPRDVFAWDGIRWQEMPMKGLHAAVERFVDKLHEDALRETDNDRKKKIREMAGQLANSKKNASVSAAISRIYDCSLTQFDNDPDLITFPNGITLDTHTGEVKEVDPNDGITKVAGAAYVPGATHPVVEEWWSTSFPDAEDRRAVQEMLGLSMSGRNYQEKMYSLYGTQGSGKGTLLYSVSAIMGDYAVIGQSASLSGNGGNDGSKKDFSDIELRGARFALTDEFSGTLGEKAKTKTQAGEMTASKKYGRDVTFSITHTNWIATNRRPKVFDPQGWNRRLIEIPMNAGAEDILNLDSSIKYTLMHDPDAMAAMLWTMVEGLNRARANEFQIRLSPNIAAATAEWLQEANKIGDWISGGCVVTGEAEDRIENAFNTYLGWMDDQGMDRKDYPRAHQNEFAGLMQSLGFERIRTMKGTAYTGLRVKKEEQGESAPVGRTGKVREMFKKKPPVS